MLLGGCHHVADDPQREGRCHLVTKSQPPRSPRGSGLVGDGGDRFFDALDALGFEGGRDDAAQPRVAGVVRRDHPAKYSTISAAGR